MQTNRPMFLLCLALMTPAEAVAAPPSPAASPQQTAPPPPSSAKCAPMWSGGAKAPPDYTVGQSNEPLSDKLAQSDGVLCPPSGVDPEIRAPTPPDTGKMPVIPPPGSPGGDPGLRPK